MTLEIITPEKEIFTGDVTSVKLPGSTGEFEILNNHAAIVSTLTNGDIRIITSDNETVNVTIMGGVVEIQENKIVVLANE